MKTDYSKYILPAGLVIGGYLIIKNLGLFGSGNAGAQNATGITDSTVSSANDSLSTAAAAGIKPTISQAQAAGIAATVYSSGINDDTQTVISALSQVNNTADVFLVIQQFGTKQAGGFACSVFGGFLSNVCQTYNLQSFVAAVLSATEISQLDGILANKGINYNF